MSPDLIYKSKEYHLSKGYYELKMGIITPNGITLKGIISFPLELKTRQTKILKIPFELPEVKIFGEPLTPLWGTSPRGSFYTMKEHYFPGKTLEEALINAKRECEKIFKIVEKKLMEKKSEKDN